jgi:S-adenosyl methyltransferase
MVTSPHRARPGRPEERLAVGRCLRCRPLLDRADTIESARPQILPFTLRSRAQILDLFDVFDPLDPGLVSLPEWRPEFNTDRTPLKGPTVGAVAQLMK